jgi:hypothetical protein
MPRFLSMRAFSKGQYALRAQRLPVSTITDTNTPNYDSTQQIFNRSTLPGY